MRADLADPAAPWPTALAGQDAVVHLAAKVDVVGPWREYARTNVDGTRRLLGAARGAGVGRFVHVSSPSVAHAGRALVGAGAGPADPARAQGQLRPQQGAGRAARAGGRAARLAVVVVRPHLVWGPGDTQLVGRIVARARAGRLAVVGTGAALIDTTYVDNAVDALVAALDRAAAACTARHSWCPTGSRGRSRELLASICAAAGVPAPRGGCPRGRRAPAGVVEAAWRLPAAETRR